MSAVETVGKAVATPSRLASLLGPLATLPGIGAALLPAITCPACWPAYAGLLSSLGLGFIDFSPWLLPVTVVFLAIALTALAWQGHKRRAYGPLLLGATGSVALVVGKFQFESRVALYTGVALVIVASVWNAWPRKVCSI
ncbi:hypothetical protein MNBD_GAMMA13-1620 [hydrothermal vent metagenome]|uniref:Mercuric transport protein, MerC n=1 Tax=hydrothermal vent metagenome TaxID=652676 RepID=A0A3B0YL56_9ZZZZ